jgi:hypothetical protein
MEKKPFFEGQDKNVAPRPEFKYAPKRSLDLKRILIALGTAAVATVGGAEFQLGKKFERPSHDKAEKKSANAFENASGSPEVLNGKIELVSNSDSEPKKLKALIKYDNKFYALDLPTRIGGNDTAAQVIIDKVKISLPEIGQNLEALQLMTASGEGKDLTVIIAGGPHGLKVHITEYKDFKDAHGHSKVMELNGPEQ